MIEVLSPLDAAFLRLEDRRSSLHIASTAIFDGPSPSYREAYDAFLTKLPLVPRYRQRVREIPLQLGRPVWIDDPHFSLRYHLRHTALPRPGSDDQLRDLVSRLMSQQLDRGKPLWETWIVDGLQGDRWAVISKLHHCMVDGIAGTDLLSLVLDTDPHAAPPQEPLPPLDPEPGRVRLLMAAASSLPHDPVGAVRSLGSAVTHPRTTADDLALRARGALSYLRLAWPAEPSSLTGPLTPHRRWGWTSITLDDVRVVRKAFGGTVNDVVLSTITRGFRELLLGRDEDLRPHAVRTLVPVSVRRPDARGRFDNRVSAVLADLPIDIADPLEQLTAVRRQLDRLKRSGEAQFGELVTSAGTITPPPLLSLGLTGVFRMPHRHIVTVATNVPGPQQPLYCCGRRMREYYPYVPIADRVRIGVAVTSYDGVLGFGVTADEDSTPDLQVLLDGIPTQLRELVALAQRTQRPEQAHQAG